MPEVPTLKQTARKYRRPKVASLSKTVKSQEEKGRFYASPAWQNLRKVYLMEHPLDELSLLEARVEGAEEVHHIQKWYDQPTEQMKWKLLLDPDNLIAVSRATHLKIHFKTSELTGMQKERLRKAKDDLFKKYLISNELINVTEDVCVTT